MTSRDFCYWLQGYFEIEAARCEPNPREYLDRAMTDTIKRHLALVFVHEIDPSIDKGDPAVAAKLNKIHEGWQGSIKTHQNPPDDPPGGGLKRC